VNDDPTRLGGRATRAVHAGERADRVGGAITTPIHQTSTYTFRDGDEVRAYQEGRLVRDEYGRYGNPTWRAVEGKLSALEEGEAAVLFSSGMCAATTLFFATVPRGGHLVVTEECYRRTRQFLTEYLAKLDVSISVIEPADLGALEAALRPETALFFTESPTNPHLRVIDIAPAAALCHAQDALLVIDSTFASPINQRALTLGADVVIHSATKYLAGHNDVLAGVAVGSAQAVAPLRHAVGILGGVLDPHAAYLLLRGLKTLELRMARHNENGMRVAGWLEGHAAVRRVWYPGLASHPDHATAKASMDGFGGVVTFELDTDLRGAERFVDACEIPLIGPSFGGVESLIEVPATMSFWDQDDETRRSLGIPDSLIRLGLGVESTEDLLADLERALGAI
jgi:cystathionine gamma-synthase